VEALAGVVGAKPSGRETEEVACLISMPRRVSKWQQIAPMPAAQKRALGRSRGMLGADW